MRHARSRFLDHQHRFFDQADAGHFLWQTQNRYLARTERALLDGFPMRSGQTILELGCGEGGNLVNLRAAHGVVPRLLVGLDLLERKLTFAHGQGVPARLVCADALALPFRDAAFDLVLCRDLLHHLEKREPALEELRRVSKPGGTVWILEPNGRNPLVWLQAMVRPHERGQLRNSVASIRDLVGRFFPRVEIEVRQPFPFYRLLLHHQFGFPRLGSSRACAAAMDLSERVLRTVWPRRWWAYIIAKLDTPPR